MTASAAPAVIHRRHLYMLPTGVGLYFGFALAAMLLVAVNYNNGLAYLFTFLLASLAVVSMIVTHRNALGLELAASPAGPVFAGDSARFRVLVGNPGDRRDALWLRCGPALQVVDAPPRGACEIEVRVRAPQRGWCVLPALTLATSYPLGLFRTWTRKIPLDCRTLVYPAPAGGRPLPVAAGGAPAPAAGGDDFSTLREYRHGDHPQHVHWKAAARGEILTKVFEGPAAHGEILLDWRLLDGMDSEAQISQLCRWLLDAEAGGLRYALRTTGGTIAAGHGCDHLQACLAHLALLDPLPPQAPAES